MALSNSSATLTPQKQPVAVNPVGPVTVQGSVQTTTQATVAVKELPVIQTRHDTLDYVSCVISFLLLVVGFGGIRYAKRTLGVIQGQLNEITKAGHQTDLMITEAKRQADAARDSADNARDTARLTQCADVLIDEIELQVAKPQFELSSRIVIHFKNFGPTRAINVKLDLTLQPGTLGDLPTLGGPIVLAAHASAPITYPTFKELGWVPHIADIQNGKISIKFSGTISYEDVFGFIHTTDCSGEYNRLTHSFNAKQIPRPKQSMGTARIAQ
jgi:hypothetical protein